MMDKNTRNLIIGLLLLVILTPLGLLAAGETFGEWGTEELEEKIGYVPPGMDSLANIWSAPLSDYGFPGNDTPIGVISGYVFSAIIGVIVCGGILYLAGKYIAKKNDAEDDE